MSSEVSEISMKYHLCDIYIYNIDLSHSTEIKSRSLAMRAFGALAVASLWRRGAADGGCAVGWTLIDDACFKVTEGQCFFFLKGFGDVDHFLFDTHGFLMIRVY